MGGRTRPYVSWKFNGPQSDSILTSVVLRGTTSSSVRLSCLFFLVVDMVVEGGCEQVQVQVHGGPEGEEGYHLFGDKDLQLC